MGIAITAMAITPIVYFVIVYFVDIIAFWAWITCWEADIVTAWATVIIALTSMVAALSGLSAYFRENKKNHAEKEDERRRDKIAVQPLLEFGSYIGVDKNSDKKNMAKFNVTLVNSGVGPAIIENFILRYKGRKKSHNDSKKYHKFLEDLLDGFNILMLTHRSSGGALRAGEETTLLEFNYEPEKDNIDFINGIKILVEYKSTYENKLLLAEYKNEHRLDYKEF